MLRFSFTQGCAIVPRVGSFVRIGYHIFLCALLLCVSAYASLAQAPGWSRGQQNLAITYDECMRRAPAALQSEGYRRDDNPGGNFAVGIKDVHTAVIICSPAPDAKMLVHIVVASNGEGGGTARQRLQARMENPGAVTSSDSSYTTWTWAYGPPGQQPEVHGSVKLYANGTIESSSNNRGTWRREGNQITMTWPSLNSVDILTLSSDGTVMAGTNNAGWNVRGTRQR
jgi:hypothetical protein